MTTGVLFKQEQDSIAMTERERERERGTAVLVKRKQVIKPVECQMRPTRR